MYIDDVLVVVVVVGGGGGDGAAAAIADVHVDWGKALEDQCHILPRRVAVVGAEVVRGVHDAVGDARLAVAVAGARHHF